MVDLVLKYIITKLYFVVIFLVVIIHKCITNTNKINRYLPTALSAYKYKNTQLLNLVNIKNFKCILLYLQLYT